MTADILVFDVGSTYTKVSCFAAPNGEDGRLRFLGRAQAPTTVDDIEKGLKAAQEAAQRQGITIAASPHVYASSSAAGGLRMVALGYMPRVTVKASKEVAMSSGARVLEVLSCEEHAEYRVQVLREIQPDIILLTGGTDGGDTDAIMDNAQAVITAVLSMRAKGKEWEPIAIVAGNLASQGPVSSMLRENSIQLWRVPNVLPTIHELRVKPAREAIHEQFIRQITRARGLSRLLEVVEGGKVIPTPGAVLLGAELIARGTHEHDGAGGLLVVDVGGATTDIHSIIPDYESLSIEERGLIVSNEKQVAFRTVEGNLGLRVSACGIVETVGPRAVLRYGDPAEFKACLGQALDENTSPGRWKELEERLSRYAEHMEAHTDTVVPEGSGIEAAFDTALATTAVAVALRRHAGFIAAEHNAVLGISPGMPMGRDLRSISNVLAVGGIFTHSSEARSLGILSRAFADRQLSLLPESPQFIIDRQYVLYALGVLGLHSPESVLGLGLEAYGLRPVKRTMPGMR
jgi:uncharacterized protein (TIGR01319 family)